MVIILLVHFTDVFFSYFAILPFIELMARITSGFGGYCLGRRNLELSFEFQAKYFKVSSETTVLKAWLCQNKQLSKFQ